MFSCKPLPAFPAEWPGSLTYCCGNGGGGGGGGGGTGGRTSVVCIY